MVQLIRGTEIASGGEVIGNVLIGEPSADGRTYTIALPKGDMHELCDSIVSFFGGRYRIIGLAQQGIEDNIPLFWHRKYRAELLEVTGSCTVYEGISYARHVFTDVFFCDSRGRKTSKTGQLPAQTAQVRIYSCSGSDGYSPKPGDIIVDGECSIVFDMTTEKTASESLAALRKYCPELPVIKEVQQTLQGRKYDYFIAAG